MYGLSLPQRWLHGRLLTAANWLYRYAVVGLWTHKLVNDRATRELDLDSRWSVEFVSRERKLGPLITALSALLSGHGTKAQVEQSLARALARVQSKMRRRRRVHARRRSSDAAKYLRAFLVPIEEALMEWETFAESVRGSFFWHHHLCGFARATLDPSKFESDDGKALAWRVGERAGIQTDVLNVEAMLDAIRYVQEVRMASRLGMEVGALQALKEQCFSDLVVLHRALKQGRTDERLQALDRSVSSICKSLEERAASSPLPPIGSATAPVALRRQYIGPPRPSLLVDA